MIRFVAKRVGGEGKLTIGLVLLPEDLAELMTGKAQLTLMDEIEAVSAPVEMVAIYFFRDLVEFQQAMQEAGVEPRFVASEGKQKFVAPPIEKIGEN
jgi:orotate phosphoribosyltransferase